METQHPAARLGSLSVAGHTRDRDGVALLSFYRIALGPMGASLGVPTVILSHIMFSLAYVVLVVLARLPTLDPRLEEAALDLGANEWQAFRRVTLALLLPRIAAAAVDTRHAPLGARRRT